MAAQIGSVMDEYEIGGTAGIGRVNREDLSNVIYEISPTKTPFMSMIGRESVKGTLHEWNIDELQSATSTNAQLTGDDITQNMGTTSVTTRAVNSTQISHKSFGISGTQEVVDKAGKRSERAYQTARKGFELRRDIEMAACSKNPRNAGASGTARQSRGLAHWIQTNVTTVAGYSFSNETTALTDGTTPAAITEANLNLVSQNIWNEGGDPSVLMVNKFNKRQVSGFVGVGQAAVPMSVNQNVGRLTLTNAVDVYITDFAELRVIPNRFQRERDAFVLDLSMWAIGFLRPFKTFPLAKIGDGERYAVLAEWTLVSRNEKASGKLADLTSS